MKTNIYQMLVETRTEAYSKYKVERGKQRISASLVFRLGTVKVKPCSPG